jgi:hypothetical protein
MREFFPWPYNCDSDHSLALTIPVFWQQTSKRNVDRFFALPGMAP